MPKRLFARLSNAAEMGRLPDWMVRLGIRRLLSKRQRELSAQQPADATTQLLQAVASQPIAVATDQANEQHYELPAEFFASVLGPRLKYSCCYWHPQTTTLAAAEQAALEITAQHADLQDGMDILELGCGWGSLSLWMAERFPRSRIVSVSNSHSQRRFILEQARQRGSGNLRVLTADVNNLHIAETFDRVVSVEMFEHVRNHQRLMHHIDDWLRPGGALFVHVFCHHSTPYLFDSTGDQDWMGRYFFTGGMMPSQDWLPRCSGPLQLTNQWSWNGMHYAKTCRAWLANMDAAGETLQPLWGKTYGRPHARRWHNRWRMFFMACEELFAADHGQQWYVSHYLFQK